MVTFHTVQLMKVFFICTESRDIESEYMCNIYQIDTLYGLDLKLLFGEARTHLAREQFIIIYLAIGE